MKNHAYTHCALCHHCHQVTGKPVLPSYKLLSCEFFSQLEYTSPPTSDPGYLTRSDVRENPQLIMLCASCQALLMRFKALQERLIKLMTLRTDKSTALAATMRGSLHGKPEAQQAKFCDSKSMKVANFDVGQTHKPGSVCGSTKEIEDDDPTLELDVDPRGTLDDLTSEPNESVGTTLTEIDIVASSSCNGDDKEVDEDGANLLEPLRSELYPHKWTPKCMFRKIKQISENGFQYEGNHPFERTTFGYRCGSCDFHTTFSKDLGGFANIYHHIRKHHVLEKYRGRRFQKKSRLIQVLPNQFLYGEFKVEKIGDEYFCGACGKGWKDLGLLSEHLNRHRPRQKSECVCEDCGKVLKNSDTLKRHKKIFHNEEQAPRLTCDECDKSFRTSTVLRNHQDRVHLKKKHFTCAFCGRQFFSEVGLRAHEKLHSGERPYECQTCGKKYANVQCLRVHESRHNPKKYTCDICDSEYTQSYSMTRHKNSAHPGWSKKTS